MLVVKSVKKKFTYPTETEILSDISFSVASGETIAIMGPSGSGKSTLLYIIGSLEAPTGGEVLLHGENIHAANPALFRQKHVGFIFQSFHLLEDYTALENLLLVPSIARESTRKESPAFKRASELLSLVGLEGKKDFPSKLLSGGEKQRIGIARALMNNPSLLLADEPTGNLDAKNGRLISSLLLRSSREYGKAMILVTHDPALAAMCDRTLVLQDGRIL